MKRLFVLISAIVFCAYYGRAQDNPQSFISFGTRLDADSQIKASRELAKSLVDPSTRTWRQKGDQHRSYFFKEAGEEMPYRIYVPPKWDGQSKLPMVVFLHGGWNDENSYLDENGGLMLKLAEKYGFLLVSPLGCHGSYGNNLILPAVFGEKTETSKIVAAGRNRMYSIDTQILSEKDVINVIELVLAEYPVDRKSIFLMGHSMGAGGTWYLGAKYRDYWSGLAPMSGPFVLETGYPWERLANLPVFITEGAKTAGKSSRDIYKFMLERDYPVEYMEVNLGHGEMVPVALPHVFQFLEQIRNGAVKEKDLSAYLFVYTKDETHSLYFALSDDGYTFTDVNNGSPVMAGDTLAEQKGIRDPYICRGPDGWFYMVMTDLHLYAKQKGYRETEWERDGSKYGWGNNRGFVFMKSQDLLHWKHCVVRIDKSFKGYDGIGCAWAPELIWDDEVGQMMIYFTMRMGKGTNKLYYSYANRSFDGLLTEPRLLFEYPKKGVSAIDGDITKIDSLYHLFYVAHDGTPGIKHATSRYINHGYKYIPDWIDSEEYACEAPMLWKRIGQEKWVLMCDVYGINPHNFGYSETSDFIHYKYLGHLNKGVMKSEGFDSPKHGAVIQITRSEADRLRDYWKARIGNH